MKGAWAARRCLPGALQLGIRCTYLPQVANPILQNNSGATDGCIACGGYAILISVMCAPGAKRHRGLRSTLPCALQYLGSSGGSDAEASDKFQMGSPGTTGMGWETP